MQYIEKTTLCLVTTKKFWEEGQAGAVLSPSNDPNQGHSFFPPFTPSFKELTVATLSSFLLEIICIINPSHEFLSQFLFNRRYSVLFIGSAMRRLSWRPFLFHLKQQCSLNSFFKESVRGKLQGNLGRKHLLVLAHAGIHMTQYNKQRGTKYYFVTLYYSICMIQSGNIMFHESK